MNDEELRVKIYERLGLEIGSLSSEGGNDWIRAEKEILEEAKQQELISLNNFKTINYLTIEKNSQEFQSVLNSDSHFVQFFKVLIAQRNDLSNDDITRLAISGDRDVRTNLAKYQCLTADVIDLIIPNSVYLIKKYLIEKQTLTQEHKKNLLQQMSQAKEMYALLLDKINEK
jgi:hypothetical protein